MLTQLRDTINKFFQDTQLHLIAALTISILLVLGKNSHAIFDHIDKKFGLNPDSFTNTIGREIDTITDKLNALPLTSTLATALFFVGVATVIYIAYIEITNTFIIARNEISLEQNSSDIRTKHYFIFRGIGKILAATLSVLATFWVIKHLLPHLLTQTTDYFMRGFENNALFSMMLAVLAITASLYVLFVCIHRSIGYIRTV